MKLTKTILKQIIREEIQRLNEGITDEELKILKKKIDSRSKAAAKKNPNLNLEDLKSQIAEFAIEQYLKDKHGYNPTRSIAYKTMLKLAPPIFKKLKIKNILYNK